MKEIDKEKWKRMIKKVRVRMNMKYYGFSNNLNMQVEINDRELTPDRMSDEEVVLLWQLLKSAQNQLALEQVKRDLIPDELKQLYMPAKQPKADA